MAKYDFIAQQMAAEEAFGSIYSSQYADAAKSARANETARRLGMAPDLVEAAMPDMLAEDRLRKRRADIERNAAYARIMSNRRLAAAAIDDDELPKVASRVGDQVTRLSDLGIGGAIAQYGRELFKGVGRASAGLYNLGRVGVESLDQIIPDNLTISGRNAGLKTLSRLLATAANIGGDLRPMRTDSRIYNDVLMGAQSIVPSIAAMTAMLVTRNPWAAGAVMGGMTAGESAEEGQAAGMSPLRALVYGGQQAVPEVGMEMIGGRILQQSLDAAMPFGRVLARQLAGEVLTEEATTLAQSGIRFANIGMPREGQGVGEWMAGLPDEMLSTAIATISSVGLMTGGSYAAGRTITKYVEGRQALNGAIGIDQVMEAAAKSPTRTANPSDFEDGLSQIVGGSGAENIYVPAEQVRALFQDAEALGEDPFWADYAEQIDEAEALGGDVVLPLARVATHLAGTPQWQQLREHTRARPGGVSIAEARAKKTPEEMEKLAAEMSSHIESAVPRIQLSQAQTAIGKWAEGMGYSGDQAQTVNRFLSAAAVSAYDSDRQRRIRFGRDPVDMDQFVRNWMPKALKGRQADFEGQELERQRARQPAPSKPAARQTKPVDVIEFVRKLGGIKDRLPHELGGTHTPHALAKGRGFARRPGLINNKSGKTIDEIGEALMEAGYFGGDPETRQRPTEAEVLELLDRAFFTKTYRPTEAADVMEAERADRINPELETAYAEIDAAMREAGMSLTPTEFSVAASYRADGMEPMAAINFAIEEAADELFGGSSFSQLFGSEPTAVATVRGDEIAPLEAEIDELRAAARRWYDENLRGKRVAAQALGGKEVIFGKGNKAFNKTADPRKIMAFAAIRQVVAQGTLIDSVPDLKDRQNIRAWHFIEAPVEIAGRVSNVRASVREDNNGNLYYNHVLQDDDPAPGTRRSDNAKPASEPGDEATYDQSIPQKEDNLNLSLGEPAQPSRTMTPEQRAELEARQKQSMARRGGQQSVKDQEGGLFSSERDQTTLFQLKRGNISITADNEGLMRTALIRAFESANFSTALHELGHFFLEDLRRRALGGEALEQETADWQAFKDWAVSLGHAVDDASPIPVEAHEYFARGMERYVWEGKAPSTLLQSLFYRMREFMLELYRTATAFNAPITPEIREMMDRMLASDAEIAERRNELGLAAAATRSLMSEAEQADYDRIAEEGRQAARGKLFERILSTLRRERGEEASARKREIEGEVTEQIDALPVFQALKLLRVGLPTDDGFAKVKLSRQWLVDAYGTDIIDRLPKGVPPIASDNDTMDADQVAMMVGFDSGDALVTALLAHEQQRQSIKAQGDKRSPRAKLIADEVDERYRTEVGDPFENIEEEAEAALVNESQADLMSMELRALSRRSGREPKAWAAAIDWARGHVRQQSSRDAISGTSLQMYSRNAAKAARETEEALVAGDFDAAFVAKQRQLLNLALLQEAKRAKDEVDKAVRRLQRIAGKATMASVDQDYLEQAHQLLEDVDMKTRPGTQVDRRKAFEDWHAEQVALGLEPIVPSKYQRLLGKTNWSKLPVEELLELDAAVDQIIQLGRLKQRLRDGRDQRDFDEGVAQLEAKADEQRARPQTAENDPNRTLGGKAKSTLRGIDAAMIKVEQMCDWLDGNDPNGPWNRLIFQPMAAAQGSERDMTRDYVARINQLVNAVDKQRLRLWDRVVSTPELRWNVRGHPMSGQPMDLRMDQVVAMALNWGNEGNRQRLLDGYGWEESEVEAVLDRLLGKAEWDFVQGVWDTVDQLWPAIEALERRVNGVAPEKIAAAKVTTRHGTYRGGYFPAVYDPSYSVRSDLDEANRLSPNGAWHNATTRASATRERAAAVKGRPLLLNMGVVTRHIGEVIHDISHREAVVQVRRVLSDPRVRSSVSSRLGPEYLKRMESWVENIATPNVSNSKNDPTMVWLARHLNKGVSLVGLGFRFSTILVQPLGLANMTAAIGEQAMLEGIRTAVARPRAAYNEIVARSAEMRSRFNTMDASIDDMVRDAASGRLATIGPKGLVRYAFHGILYMDLLITTAGWIGAFNQGLEKGMNEDEATHWADKIVRTTQGAGGQKDRSAIMYSNEFARTFWPFFSYLNALYNQQRDVMHRGVRGEVGEAARRSWWIVVVPTLVQALMFGEGPGDDEDNPESWAEYLTKAVMLGNFASIPGIGPIANAIGSGYGYRSNAWQGIGEGIKKGWDDLDRVMGEGEPLKGSTIKSIMTTIGILSARPLGQIGATSQGIYDYATGEAEPQDAGDWYELLTKGRVSDEPTAMERLAGESE